MRQERENEQKSESLPDARSSEVRMSRRRLFTLGAAGTVAVTGTLLGASVSMARQ
ncbi:hypothetical protein PV433_01485 [Paenibacillus sp. GYB004]|uniref:hypothetical protein n=1 Tax=Paenibacillus sp. GYB004 TaxID=2994393 RepID=UPI002F96E43B